MVGPTISVFPLASLPVPRMDQLFQGHQTASTPGSHELAGSFCESSSSVMGKGAQMKGTHLARQPADLDPKAEAVRARPASVMESRDGGP